MNIPVYEVNAVCMDVFGFPVCPFCDQPINNLQEAGVARLEMFDSCTYALAHGFCLSSQQSKEVL